MGDVLRVIKDGRDPNPPKTKTRRVKCKECKCIFEGNYYAGEYSPEWTCPHCGTTVDKKGREVYEYDDD